MKKLFVTLFLLPATVFCATQNVTVDPSTGVLNTVNQLGIGVPSGRTFTLSAGSTFNILPGASILGLPNLFGAQPLNSNLTALSNITGTTSSFPVFTSATTMSAAAISPFSQGLLSGSNVAAWKSALSFMQAPSSSATLSVALFADSTGLTLTYSPATFSPSGALTIPDTTQSSGTLSGSATFAGGIGIQKNVRIGGNLGVTTDISMGFPGAANFLSSQGSSLNISSSGGSITLSGNVAVTGTITGTGSVPIGGGSGQVLEKTSNADYAFAWVTPAAGSGPASPTQTIDITVHPGTSATFMRSDAAPALSQAITPTWTGAHVFNGSGIPVTINGNANSQSLLVTASSTASQSYGAQILGGTNASDYGLSVLTQAGSSTFKVDGAGQLHAPLFYNSAGLIKTDASGNFTPSTTISLSSLTVSGASTFGATTISGAIKIGGLSAGTLVLDGSGNLTSTTSSGGAVSSVFGRTGVVLAATNDYTQNQITGLSTSSAPTFAGLNLSGFGAGFVKSTSSGTLSSTALASSDVTTALGFTPYNASNPSGYLSSITSGNVTSALGFTPANKAGDTFSGSTTFSANVAFGGTINDIQASTHIVNIGQDSGHLFYTEWIYNATANAAVVQLGTFGENNSVIYDAKDFTYTVPGLSNAFIVNNSGKVISGGEADTGAQLQSGGAGVAGSFDRSTDGVSVNFYHGNLASAVGSISVTSTTTAFNTTSDRRLKTNITDFTASGPIIDAIQPREFDWKVNGNHDRGFIAQELYQVYPGAVLKGDDDATIKDQWAVDYSKLVPVLVAEVKALRARVAALEAAQPH